MNKTKEKRKPIETNTGNGKKITSGVSESDLRELTHKLSERVKELNCLYGISRLVEDRNSSIDEILQGVVDLMP
jgi:2-oxoglutarate dehydrogenase complex dehydrogenase (E1) component-like enzyme